MVHSRIDRHHLRDCYVHCAEHCHGLAEIARKCGFGRERESGNNANVAVLEIPGDLTERQLFFAGDQEAFEYDDDGNMTADGLWTYEWDAKKTSLFPVQPPSLIEHDLLRSMSLCTSVDHRRRSCRPARTCGHSDSKIENIAVERRNPSALMML